MEGDTDGQTREHMTECQERADAAVMHRVGARDCIYAQLITEGCVGRCEGRTKPCDRFPSSATRTYVVSVEERVFPGW